jgi:RimJ/RimL family protein N-acetyltransferase
VHGIARPVLRRTKVVDQVVSKVLRVAFDQLDVYKIKAEFDADNRAAKGFCLRMGFTREALLKADTQRGAQKQDIALYSLFAPCYRAFTQRRLPHA